MLAALRCTATDASEGDRKNLRDDCTRLIQSILVRRPGLALESDKSYLAMDVERVQPLRYWYNHVEAIRSVAAAHPEWDWHTTHAQLIGLGQKAQTPKPYRGQIEMKPLLSGGAVMEMRTTQITVPQALYLTLWNPRNASDLRKADIFRATCATAIAATAPAVPGTPATKLPPAAGPTVTAHPLAEAFRNLKTRYKSRVVVYKISKKKVRRNT